MKDFLHRLILQGKIPYILLLKKIFFWIAIISPLSVFFFYREYEGFGSLGWAVLVGVLLVRPLADIFVEFKILRALIALRREFGIFSGLLIAAHFVGYTLTAGVPILDVISDPNYWSLKNFFGWGIFGLAFAIPVLLTSNTFSMKLLKKRWKTVQRLSYFFFFFGGVHIALVGEASGAVGIVVVGLALLLAKMGVKVEILSRFQK